MRTEEEIRTMLKKCHEIPVGGELELYENRYNFWEGLSEFEDALKWVLNDKEEK
jgi:hypothetical protein